jgi:polar amino acid transport system substrate-binding protein
VRLGERVVKRAFFLLAASLACLLAACSTTSTAVGRSATRALPTTSTSTPGAAPTTTTAPPCNPTQSVAPSTVRGPSVRAIIDRKILKVGVDQNTPGFANVGDDGKLHGFEIEIARQLARRIFDDPNGDQNIRWVALPTADRLTAVQDGQVDMTISLVTATCTRKAQVLLSDVYFTANQSLLVPTGSAIKSAADVKGKRICATKGSTSLDNIQKVGAVPFPVETRPECLVALQQGKVDGITSDDTILAGFHDQDAANTALVPIQIPNGQQPYAIAMSLKRQDLGQYVNSILDDMRASGQLEALRNQYLVPLDIPEDIPDKLGNTR